MKHLGLFFLSLSSLFLLQGCNSNTAQDTQPTTPTPPVEVVEAEVVEPTQDIEQERAIENDAVAGTTTVLLETDLGDMEIVLYDATPLHRDNFIKLIKEGYYDDLLFHRVIKGFMVQGGDPDSRDAAPTARLGTGGPEYKIDAEIGEFHYKGTLAAARQGGAINPEKKSSGSQFYIVQGTPQTEASLLRLATQKGITYSPQAIARYIEVGGTPMLDADYTVFGEVVSGLDVIDKIAAVETASGDRPTQDVKMNLSIIK